ncbi:MAG: flagellar hook-associated protein FlgK [Cellvibrionales bacterium]|nr:flagellar hook-associated protein FlgK [Cellvibrionales bacterium]
MGLLNIGVTGLLASQTAINTTGHNIANANVQGYSRQEVVLETNTPRFGGGGFVGNGVEVETIRRITNEFITQQLRTDTANFAELDAFATQISQLDSVIAGANTGLTAALDSFFSSLQAVADSPTSLPARQLVLSEGERLAQRFNVLQSGINAQTDNVNGQIRSIGSEVDQLAQSIAKLNGDIAAAQGFSTSDQVNDLLDRREEALRQLSELVSFSTSEQDGNIINVFVGGGQPLVLGSNSNRVVTMDNPLDASRTELAIDVNNNLQMVTDSFSGGKLGGLLRYRDNILDSVQGNVGVLALAVTDIFNAQHRAGIDLNSQQGIDFFTPINTDALMRDRIKASSNNGFPNDRVATVSIDNISELTGSNYRLNLGGSGTLNYTLVRASDQTVVSSGMLSSSFPQTIMTDQGFSINLSSGSFQNSDSFLISPSLSAAESMALNVQDTASLALGSPIIAGASLGNTGTGVITQGGIIRVGEIDSQNLPAFATAGQLSPPLLIRFTSASTYDVLDNSDPLNPQNLSPPLRNQTFAPNQSNNLLPQDLSATYISTSAAHVFGAQVGIIGSGVSNGYPDPNPLITSETITVNTVNAATGSTSVTSVNLLAGESAATAAARINTLNGVTATANTSATLNIVDDGDPGLLRIRFNGVTLSDPALGAVPNPLTSDFLAERINQVFAGSGTSASSDGTLLTVRSVNGADLRFEEFGSDPNDRLEIVNINGAATNVFVFNNQEAVVGGTIDVITDAGSTISTSGGLFTNPTPQPLPVYLGYQVSLAGSPDVGDTFSIGFNDSGAGDNRNALALASLQTADILDNGSLSIAQGYSQLVAQVGSQTGAANIDREAVQSLLFQTTARRDSVAGVNLDEEAARLIQFQQSYTASAQIITVAREIFDTLLGAFR